MGLYRVVPDVLSPHCLYFLFLCHSTALFYNRLFSRLCLPPEWGFCGSKGSVNCEKGNTSEFICFSSLHLQERNGRSEKSTDFTKAFQRMEALRAGPRALPSWATLCWPPPATLAGPQGCPLANVPAPGTRLLLQPYSITLQSSLVPRP